MLKSNSSKYKIEKLLLPMFINNIQADFQHSVYVIIQNNLQLHKYPARLINVADPNHFLQTSIHMVYFRPARNILPPFLPKERCQKRWYIKQQERGNGENHQCKKHLLRLNLKCKSSQEHRTSLFPKITRDVFLKINSPPAIQKPI